ncbi:NSS family neurotransmitter:Na+ symporter [Williamsia limnetica]|uniref:Transporter n=1 Tax=Williamsia limnetica TaxID=882452 RepID=A0A318S036_WILLI|nr:NSS family neurotransmitter:Na+ symporter [Williamsia limnetica]
MAEQVREQWSTRTVFILAAIGSAVGLGNIWRFPYVAYDNGGGAFIIPYLIALLTAGIPLLFFDYAIGHKFRGSPPLAFKRLHKRAEVIGWWQVGVSFVIAVYYAVIIAWAARYTIFSLDEAWGDDAATFFSTDFLQQDSESTFGFNYVTGVWVPLLLVWIAVIAVLALGVQKGIGSTAKVFVPLLVTLFSVLVVRALFLDGAGLGLDALFTPDWSALTDSGVWIAAYGQIFFSLSIAFGIMITYASYLKRKTNMTGSGLVVAFSNSGFEILAGIGVFAVLGYMAQSDGVAVSEVASSGIGLAFIAFPSVISMMPGGPIFGVLFFGCLVFAGFTSLVSIVQVIISGLQDKTGMARVPAVLLVGTVCTAVSMILLPTTTGLNVLDVLDKFANNIGIVSVAVVALVVVSWFTRSLPALQDDLNAVSSFKLGIVWRVFLGVITPVVLAYMLIDEVSTLISDGYGGLPTGLVVGFGWVVQLGVVALAIVLSFLPWQRSIDLTVPSTSKEEAK